MPAAGSSRKRKQQKDSSNRRQTHRQTVPGKKSNPSLSNLSKTLLIAPTLLLALLGIVILLGERWLAGPYVNTPLDVPLAVSNEWRNESVYRTRLWGTYRSNVYLGVRPRIPKSLVFGMMWFVYEGQLNIRHTCEHGDKLLRYGWLRHDGDHFGQQEIVDNAMTLRTEFLSRSDPGLGETWTVRLVGESRVTRPLLVSVILYVYNEGEGEMAYHTTAKESVEEIYGYTPEFTQYRVYFVRKNISNDAVHNYMSTRLGSVVNLSAFMRSLMKTGTPHKHWPTIAQLPGVYKPPDVSNFKTNFVAYQVTAQLPFELDMVFETGMFSAAMSISGERFTTSMEKHVQQFDERFENTFQLQKKGFSESEISFAKAAFSNLLGGISYFYGQSQVISRDLAEPVPYWSAPLYTAVPSRSFFPRGFLWDEGFHQLLVAHWDITIVKDVLAHWLDLINIEGWIPREQILGDEASSKVPREFVVQHNENANPPTFFLTLETLIDRMQEEDKMDLVFLSHLYPRLQVWFDWFNTTQAGDLPTTYRWRGRNETTDRELNPKTLTSGLDDFPRASHPSSDEYHVDLRCWMALGSTTMARIATLIGKNALPYKVMSKTLTDQKLLDRLHWDSKKKTYSDYGLHTSAMKLVRVSPPQPNLPSFKRRKVSKEPSLRLVNSYGYVQLFPFLLRLVSPTSDKLGYILEKLRHESMLWTDYGLRSLAKKDPFYNKWNTEHDPPYWRGAIWLNMNYLAVRALHYYSTAKGPYHSEASQLYQELRSNLIRNMHEQYIRTGYVWEQYDDDIGTGKGTHPFTGWSSLIVLIMAEKY